MLLETWWEFCWKIIFGFKKNFIYQVHLLMLLSVFLIVTRKQMSNVHETEWLLWVFTCFVQEPKDISAHAQRNHLMAERFAVSPHGFGTERDADCLHERPSLTRLQPSANTRTERWKQQSRCVEVCTRWISTWNAACGGLSAAFWIAPSLHGSSRECHENQKSWLRDCCSSLSNTRRPRRRRRWRRRRRRREMDTARKIRIR